MKAKLTIGLLLAAFFQFSCNNHDDVKKRTTTRNELAAILAFIIEADLQKAFATQEVPQNKWQEVSGQIETYAKLSTGQVGMDDFAWYLDGDGWHRHYRIFYCVKQTGMLNLKVESSGEDMKWGTDDDLHEERIVDQ
jgi:hypothetical protein